MQALWNWVARIGVDETVDPADVKHITLCNIFALVTALLVLSYIPMLAPYWPLSAPVIWIDILGALGFASGILLNALRRHSVARLFTAAVGLLVLVANSIYLGNDGLLPLYLVAVIFYAFAVIPDREAPVMYAQVALAVLTYVFLEIYLTYNEPFLNLHQDEETMGYSARGGLFVLVALFAYYNFRVIRRAQRDLQVEHDRAEHLLLNILPAPIARRLKARPETIAERFDDATILFADLVNFTPLARTMSAADLVRLLDRIFREFDALVDDLGLEKIKTIGDAYMVAGGVPEPRADHASAVANLALGMRRVMEARFAGEGHDLQLRIGIHTGPVVAGVIGRRKFVYDLWGDSVNTASRMESHGEPGKIQISGEVRTLLGDAYEFTPRGSMEIKGRGAMETYFLDGRRASA